MELRLTPRAAQAVRRRARDAGVEGWPLRVAVVAGGCNGLIYDLYFVESPTGDDAVVETEGVRVAIDPHSARLIDGCVVDLPGRGERGFSFQNPAARRTCSCGASFEV